MKFQRNETDHKRLCCKGVYGLIGYRRSYFVLRLMMSLKMWPLDGELSCFYEEDKKNVSCGRVCINTLIHLFILENISVLIDGLF